MTREEVREKIAYMIAGWANIWWDTTYKEKADQILAIKGIRIEADDQSLPTYNSKPFMEGEKAKFFIKALNKAGWGKCQPKGEK